MTAPRPSPPLGVLPDAVVAHGLRCSRRSVARARQRRHVPSHTAMVGRYRASVEAQSSAGLRRMRSDVLAAVRWAGYPERVPPVEMPLDLWRAYMGIRAECAARAGCPVPHVADPVMKVRRPDRVDWHEHPVGLLPPEVIAAVVGRTPRQVRRVASLTWEDGHARVWRAAASGDAAWLRAAAQQAVDWILDWCGMGEPAGADEQFVLLDLPSIIERPLPGDPVALAHHYEALVAHCRRMLLEG